MKKIKVGLVNYLNTLPLLYGIDHSTVKESVELIGDYPSNIASYLMDDRIDVGLVPVVVLAKLQEYHIHTDYCIGCDGPVASVCLFSDVPIQDVSTVLLDYQSRTSVALLKILLQDYWKVTPQLINTASDYRSSITGSTAGLVIGDRSFEQRTHSRYVYDLGEAWKLHTGLPFVFAAWISRKRLDEQFIIDFNKANKFGVDNITKVAESTSFPLFDTAEYFTKYISYRLDSQKRKGLNRFLQLLNYHENSGRLNIITK